MFLRRLNSTESCKQNNSYNKGQDRFVVQKLDASVWMKGDVSEDCQRGQGDLLIKGVGRWGLLVAKLGKLNKFLDKFRLLDGPTLAVRKGREGEQKVQAKNNFILEKINIF